MPLLTELKDGREVVRFYKDIAPDGALGGRKTYRKPMRIQRTVTNRRSFEAPSGAACL